MDAWRADNAVKNSWNLPINYPKPVIPDIHVYEKSEYINPSKVFK